jgi:hypothetical protein
MVSRISSNKKMGAVLNWHLPTDLENLVSLKKLKNNIERGKVVCFD